MTHESDTVPASDLAIDSATCACSFGRSSVGEMQEDFATRQPNVVFELARFLLEVAAMDPEDVQAGITSDGSGNRCAGAGGGAENQRPTLCRLRSVSLFRRHDSTLTLLADYAR